MPDVERCVILSHDEPHKKASERSVAPVTARTALVLSSFKIFPSLSVTANTKLAVVEAKAWDKALTEGVAQAKDYAAKLAKKRAKAEKADGA